MKALLLALTLTTSLPAQTAPWTKSHEADLEKATVTFAARLPKQTAIIGRTGILDTRVAVFINQDGHLLAPFIPSIDGEDAPYLLYQADGTRLPLTTVAENPKRFVALLKLDNPPPDLLPVRVAKVIDHTVILPTLAPISAIGEPVSFFVDHLEFPPVDDAKAIRLDATFSPLGTPVFDLSGALVAITLKPRESNTPALMISSIIAELPELAQVIADETISDLPRLPQAVELTREEMKETTISPITRTRQQFLQETHPSPLPCVLISNKDSQATHSVIGTIVRSDGLIITKASELGPNLDVRFNGKNYPAVLLSTDEASDLALVGIDEKNMPVVHWATEEVQPGATLTAPILLQESTPDMVSEPSCDSGVYSHILKAGTPTVHDTSQVTSLGLTTEQLDSGITIAAIKSETPAFEAGLSPGDLIESINADPIKSRANLTAFLNSREVGETVTIKIKRAGESKEFAVELISPNLMPPTTGITMSSIPMIPSVRRAPFPDVIVHTIPLNAWDCGSPLFDPAGRALGLNIAAISATRTIALQPTEVRAALERLLAKTRAF